MIDIKPDDTPDGHEDGHAFLLLRKHRYTGTISYYLCWSPRPVPLAKLIATAVARWKIEEDHQIYKQATGLDSGQVTTWTSWHRWTAISLLAGAFLAAAAARQRARDGDAAALELIPVTIPELLRQLRGTVIPWPAAARRTATHGPSGDAATSIAHARHTSAGTPTLTSCHSRSNGLQLPQLDLTDYSCRSGGWGRGGTSPVSLTSQRGRPVRGP
jgi:hypothetical protein